MFSCLSERPRQASRAVSVRGLCALAIIAAVALAGCGDDFFDVGPQILDVRVEPNQLSESEAFNERHEVTIEVSGFEGNIVDANAFIQENDREANPAEVDVVGNTVILEGLERGWFGGLSAGTYSVGADVVSDEGEDIQQLDLETVTITQ